MSSWIGVWMAAAFISGCWGGMIAPRIGSVARPDGVGFGFVVVGQALRWSESPMSPTEVEAVAAPTVDSAPRAIARA